MSRAGWIAVVLAVLVVALLVAPAVYFAAAMRP